MRKANKYFPFVFIYFFVNSLALPFGLLYTSLLAPLFYIWILLTRKKEVLLPFIAILAPFIVVQIFYIDIIRKVYFISLLNIVLVYISCQAVYTFLKTCKDVERIFRKLLIINFILCLVAMLFYFTPYYHIFWIEQTITEGVSNFRRLKMFTYEASYYATLFVPIFCFYFLQYFFKQNRIKGGLLLLMILLPLILSFSIGVTGALLIATLLTFLIHWWRLIQKRRVFNSILSAGTLSLFIWPVLLFFRNNVFFTRLSNIFTGHDVSGKGRTIDAYVLAVKLLGEKNKWWGIGIGQIKVMGANTIRDYYMYYTDAITAIPNAVAETLAIFGWLGVAVRILIELFLFYYTRVWMNYYRLLLFFFVFIYQFTGSFITNIAEYVIWILAFTNLFTQFDVKTKTASSL